MQIVGHVAQLDHGGHVFRLFACAAHVKIVGGCALGSARLNGWPFQLSQRANAGGARSLNRLITYGYCHIESSIRQRLLSILERSGQAGNERCSILWTSNFAISLDWKRETVNR